MSFTYSIDDLFWDEDEDGNECLNELDSSTLPTFDSTQPDLPEKDIHIDDDADSPKPEDGGTKSDGDHDSRCSGLVDDMEACNCTADAQMRLPGSPLPPPSSLGSPPRTPGSLGPSTLTQCPYRPIGASPAMQIKLSQPSFEMEMEVDLSGVGTSILAPPSNYSTAKRSDLHEDDFQGHLEERANESESPQLKPLPSQVFRQRRNAIAGLPGPINQGLLMASSQELEILSDTSHGLEILDLNEQHPEWLNRKRKPLDDGRPEGCRQAPRDQRGSAFQAPLGHLGVDAADGDLAQRASSLHLEVHVQTHNALSCCCTDQGYRRQRHRSRGQVHPDRKRKKIAIILGVER